MSDPDDFKEPTKEQWDAWEAESFRKLRDLLDAGCYVGRPNEMDKEYKITRTPAILDGKGHTEIFGCGKDLIQTIFVAHQRCLENTKT